MLTGSSTCAAAQLDIEGRRLVEMALDQSATRHLQPAITQALRCLDRGLELSCRASSDTPLDTKYRDTLTGRLTDDCDPAHKKAVQQLLKQCS